MNIRLRPRLGWALAMLLGAVPTMVQAEGPVHGRISYDAEGTFLLGKTDVDWAHASLNTLVLVGDSIWVDEDNTSELELASGAYLRMAHEANIEVLELGTTIRVRGITGSFYLHRLSESSGELLFETPAANVAIPPNALVRVDIEPNGGTTVYVLDGGATITIGADHQQSLGSGLQVYIEPGHLSSETQRFDGLNDDFDVWNRERVAYITTGYRNSVEGPEFDRRPLGTAELSSSGRWIDYSGARYWQPDASLAYVPYRDGYWTRVANCGDVWVGRYGFEYTTSHYGRWTYVERHGWLWRYDSVWSPAWVAAVKYGPDLVWSPLGFDNRPVVVGTGASFQVGGLSFSFGASTLVPVEQVYLGYNYVQPARIELLPRIEQRDIQIWNIDINNVVINTVGANYGGFALYKSNSSRTVRGLFAVGNGRRAPHDIVAALRANVGVTADFKVKGKVLAGPSAFPKGKGAREVHLKEYAKFAKTQAGPGNSKARAASGDPRNGGIGGPKGHTEKAGGAPDKGNKGHGPDAKGKGNSGPSDKGSPAKGKGAGEPQMKNKGVGGPPDKGDKGGGSSVKGKGGSSDKGGKSGGPAAKNAGGPPDKGSKGGGSNVKATGAPSDKGGKGNSPNAKGKSGSSGNSGKGGGNGKK